MELNRRSVVIYTLLALVWALIVGWQAQEHARVRDYARNGLRNRSKDIAKTLGSFIRGLQFRGAVLGDRLQPVLDDLVFGRTNDLFRSTEVVTVALLNAAGEPLALAGRPIDLQQKDVQEGERWGHSLLTVVYPIEGASVSPEGSAGPGGPVLLPPFTNNPREGPRGFRGPPPDGPPRNATNTVRPPRAPERDEPRPRRPFWARGMNEADYQAMIQKRELHGLVLAMSTETFESVVRHDLWLRFIIGFFATISVIGSGLAWRNISKTSDLQIRLLRAGQLNAHLKEMNVAAAGLAHETRNPLNIIRGLAQLISKDPATAPEIQRKSRDIVDEADKVAAQLNEFINYSRPREVRRTPVSITAAFNEVTRALSYDVQEKHLNVQLKGEPLTIQADEQLFRQALFNLLINAVQAVDDKGQIEVVAQRTNASEGMLEIRDNGPGVLPEHRLEIFKPYFTTHKTGTGLGLAVVQQIVLAHGWEIECASHNSRGAVFRITHLKLAN